MRQSEVFGVAGTPRRQPLLLPGVVSGNRLFELVLVVGRHVGRSLIAGDVRDPFTLLVAGLGELTAPHPTEGAGFAGLERLAKKYTLSVSLLVAGLETLMGGGTGEPGQEDPATR